MRKLQNNFAFIDSQNLNLGIKKLGWKLDYKRFRVYLSEKYSVKNAYVFIGYIASNQRLYDSLEGAGFILKFKPISTDSHGEIKGNVDSDIVLQIMIDWYRFDKAVIVTSDGDFYSVTNHLYLNNKLETILSPKKDKCSGILKKMARDRINYLSELKERLEYK